MSNGGYTSEDLEAILESLEFDESDEADEAVRGGRRPSFRRPPPTASNRGSYRQPVENKYVTQKELQENIQRVDAKIAQNSKAIETVNGRVNTVSADISRQAAALKKETEERKKDTARLASQAQLAALLPLLTAPKTVQLSNPVDTIPAGSKVVLDGGDSLSLLLPLLLVGGLGSGTGLGSGSGGGDAGSLGGLDPLLLVLLLTSRR